MIDELKQRLERLRDGVRQQASRMAGAVRSHLVSDWRQCWRWWSVQLHAAIALLMVLVSLVPGIPPEILNIIPPGSRAPIIAAYSLLGIVLRVLKQRQAAS